MDLITILKDKGIPYKNTNDPSTILIKCTSGLHDDKNPSLSYNLEKNLFKCWSCDFKGGSAKFCQSIGIVTRVPIETKQTFKVQKLRQKLKSLSEKDGFSLPKTMTSVDFPFKGISETVLQEFNTFLTPEFGLEEYICIPVYQFGRLKFIEGRLRFNSKKPKYYRRPAGASVNQVLFPLDKIEPTKEIILVEGIFDMLNMWQHGFRNVLCIFGTQNFGPKKVELLDQVGITKVHLLLDGDAAGARAAVSIEKLLEANSIQVRNITLPPDKDPGNLSKYELNHVLK